MIISFVPTKHTVFALFGDIYIFDLHPISIMQLELYVIVLVATCTKLFP